MLRITQLWLLFLLFHPSVPAQWVQQSFPSTEYLARVRFHNEQTGWILGGEQIYRTDDGGVTWVPKDSTGGLGLVLALADDSTIVYANSSGLIRRTSDGGETWRTIDDHGAYYEDMTFVDSLTGFAVGSDTGAPSAIWKTTDGGASWVMVADTLPPAGHNGVGVSFVDPMTGYVLTYDEEMFRTTDGGVTWNHVDSFQPSYAPMSSDDVQFIDADHGWAIGGISGSIYIARTTDGGVTWQDSTGGGSTREIDFVDDQTGWIVQGLGDVPMKSTDGGRTWERQISGSLPPMESIDMIDDQIGWIVGGGGTVYRTMNGGSAPNHQPDSVLAFYPLQIGNKWQYLYSYCYCECQTPTESYHIEEVVGDTVLGNGLRYQVLISDLPETEYTQFFRVDSLTGNIYRYSGGAEVLHDSLLASEGSTFMTDWGYLT
ncbi:MAG: YCF48-related protein, partial [Ignavibacteria bacterium]|nr:YCF48-related protein [Ignavibacteria bacterium]